MAQFFHRFLFLFLKSEALGFFCARVFRAFRPFQEFVRIFSFSFDPKLLPGERFTLMFLTTPFSVSSLSLAKTYWPALDL